MSSVLDALVARNPASVMRSSRRQIGISERDLCRVRRPQPGIRKGSITVWQRRAPQIIRVFSAPVVSVFVRLRIHRKRKSHLWFTPVAVPF